MRTYKLLHQFKVDFLSLQILRDHQSLVQLDDSLSTYHLSDVFDEIRAYLMDPDMLKMTQLLRTQELVFAV
ncbi:hypothetical protein Tco_1023097 [Tanacetum coccineum]